jgi:hypothetical protein
MFPAIMPWLMTLAPTNEAIRHGNHAAKTSIRGKKYRNDWVVMQDVRIALLSKKQRFCESRRKRNRTYGPDVFCFNF